MPELSNLVAIVPVTDPVLARTFYEGTLGLQFVVDDGFAIVMRSGSNVIRLVKVDSFTPQPFTLPGWQTPDVPGAVAALTDKGVVFERYDGMSQDELGVWTPPGGGHVAWFKDTEGNLLSLSGRME